MSSRPFGRGPGGRTCPGERKPPSPMQMGGYPNRQRKINRKVKGQGDPSCRQRPKRQPNTLQKKEPHQAGSNPRPDPIAPRIDILASHKLAKDQASDPAEKRPLQRCLAEKICQNESKTKCSMLVQPSKETVPPGWQTRSGCVGRDRVAFRPKGTRLWILGTRWKTHAGIVNGKRSHLKTSPIKKGIAMFETS